MNVTLNVGDPCDYQTFLKIKALPHYRITGREASFPDEYSSLIMRNVRKKQKHVEPTLHPALFVLSTRHCEAGDS